MLKMARTMLGQCLMRAAYAETSQQRDVQVSQDGEEKFYWELVELADGITRGDGHVGMPAIVKRAPCFQLRIIEGVVADVLLCIHEIGHIRVCFLRRYGSCKSN
jgi:hypothetical protein